ncbi:hypothetical protein C4K39_5082 [Pseudomonas sessilinigenes]|nr:hypothetical protein C4K39_5082 [Pseudomonas sessilinigenes]
MFLSDETVFRGAFQGSEKVSELISSMLAGGVERERWSQTKVG